MQNWPVVNEDHSKTEPRIRPSLQITVMDAECKIIKYKAVVDISHSAVEPLRLDIVI